MTRERPARRGVPFFASRSRGARFSARARRAARPVEWPVHDPAAGFTVPLRDLGDETPAWRGILAPVDAPREAPAGVTAQFLEHAADYHERYANVAHFRPLLDDAFARLERPPAPRTILDIGSGSGNSVIPLLDRFPDAFVVATDISAPLLAILRDHLAANERYRGRFALVAVDAVDAPLRRASFDLAVGAAILHHVLAPERVVDACRVALRAGGVAVFLEPFEMGHAVLSLAYAGIVDEARRRGEDGPGLGMVRTPARRLRGAPAAARRPALPRDGRQVDVHARLLRGGGAARALGRVPRAPDPRRRRAVQRADAREPEARRRARRVRVARVGVGPARRCASRRSRRRRGASSRSSARW